MKQKRLYVAIDIAFWRDDKVIAAGLDAACLFLQGLCWSRERMADGFIPSKVAPTLGATYGLTGQRATRAVSALVEEGMWFVVDGGYTVDPAKWAEWQQTRESIEVERERDRERKRKAKERREESDRTPAGIPRASQREEPEESQRRARGEPKKEQAAAADAFTKANGRGHTIRLADALADTRTAAAAAAARRTS
jgi:hypothetical protein